MFGESTLGYQQRRSVFERTGTLFPNLELFEGVRAL